jgi:hypothetical protein
MTKSGCLAKNLSCNLQQPWHPKHTRKTCCEATCRSTERRCRNQGKYNWTIGAALINTIKPPQVFDVTVCDIHDRKITNTLEKIYAFMPMIFLQLIIGFLVKSVSGIGIKQHKAMLGSNENNVNLFKEMYAEVNGIHQKIDVVKRFIRKRI